VPVHGFVVEAANGVFLKNRSVGRNGPGAERSPKRNLRRRWYNGLGREGRWRGFPEPIVVPGNARQRQPALLEDVEQVTMRTTWTWIAAGVCERRGSGPGGQGSWNSDCIALESKKTAAPRWWFFVSWEFVGVGNKKIIVYLNSDG